MTCSTSGDLGDVVSGVLGTLQTTPGKHTVLLRDDGRTKGIVKRAHLITPLIKAQPYIDDCRVWNGEEVDWVSEKFRNGFHSTTNTLLYAHASHAKSVGLIDNLPLGREQWLFATPDKKAEGRVVINRSPRYQNPHFPWNEVVKFYGSAIMFVGLPEEHYMFEQLYGKVEYRPTKDLLETARLIAGSQLFIGNQSVAFNVAEGLKVQRILEMCLTVCDCVYPPDGKVQWVADGAATLPPFTGGDPVQTPSRIFDISHIHPSFIPPGGWVYGQVMTSNLDTCVREAIRKGETGTKEEVQQKVLEANLRRKPRFFLKQMPTAQFSLARRAIQNAGVNTHPLLDIV